MTFLDASLLGHLIWLLPAAAAVAAWGASRRSRRLRLWAADDALRRHLTANVSQRGRVWRQVFMGAALALLMLAVARPVWGEDMQERPRSSRDILLVVDTSRSMLATDVPPSRLRHATFLARRIVDRLPGDRFGVIAFAGEASLVCPLTPNRESLVLYLDQLDTDSIPIGGTNLPAAFERVQDAFQAAADDYRAVVLITDGENLGDDPAPLLATLRERHVPVYAVGIGDPDLGSFIQLPDGSFVVDENGNRVRSVLDEPGLRAIGQATGGAYVHSTVTADGLDELVAYLKKLTPQETDEVAVWTPIERFQIPLAAAILLLLVRLLFSERRSRPAVPTVAPLLVAACLYLAGSPSASAQLDSLDERPPPESAPVAALPTPPQNPALVALRADVDRLVDITDSVKRVHRRYELALRFDSLDATSDARQQYEKVVGNADSPPALRAAALQNLGVLAHRRGKESVSRMDMKSAEQAYTQAGDFYRESMRLRPMNAGLARNVELLLRDIREMNVIKEREEALKQAQEEAKKQAEEALKKQQSAANPETPQDQSASDQQEANDATQAASDAAETIQKLAGEKGDAQTEGRAQAANHELQAARSAQNEAAKATDPAERQRQQEKAAGHIQNALEQLDASEKENKDDENSGDATGESGDAGDEGKPKPGDPKQEQPKPDGQEPEGQPETSPDPQTGEPQQAQPPPGTKSQNSESLLNEMKADERDLQEAIRDSNGRPGGRRVERNW